MTEKIQPIGNRRDFCRQAASLAMIGPLTALLDACGSSPTSPSATASALPIVTGVRGSTGITVTVDSASPLAAVGSGALVQTPSGDYLVAHTSQDVFSALSAMCTHQACTITGISNSDFVCPCHGSTFDTSGRVVAGPAPAPLHQYPTQFANGVLTITA
jgi:cytochrome b6-f complex iron-sulfur subunit